MTLKAYEKAKELMYEIERLKQRREYLADLLAAFGSTTAERSLKFNGFETKAVTISADIAQDVVRLVYNRLDDELVELLKHMEEL